VVVQSADSAVVPFLVVNLSGREGRAQLTLHGVRCRPEAAPQPVSLGPHGWRAMAVACRLDPEADEGTVTASLGGASASVTVRRGLDLTALPWKQSFAPRTSAPEMHRAALDADDAAWPELRVPSLWNDNRYAWCRVHVTIPASWKGRPVQLHMAAVDDNDITYLNGSEIGRTSGWDIPRDYRLPPERILWGRDNVITVMVDNPTYGGGLYKAPLMLLVGDASPPSVAAAPQARPRRPRPGKIGRPLPLRPMRVRDGVLRYADGSEVALWGVNIYPQSWFQFENMKRLKLDMKAVMRTDFDHLQQMGVEAIRIHVFDREISGGDGSITDNEHLDLLDYLVAECSRRGIYLYFTPIAWWGGPNENPKSFSARTSKPGMMIVPEARTAAANYLAQFLTRKNRYTGRAYKDEPSLCVLEVMNEPTYFLYGDLTGSAYPPQGESAEVLERDHQVFRAQWADWLRRHELADSSSVFPLFRYDWMRRYIREMVSAIQATGARQPVAISFFGVNGDDIAQAIADSECDAVTFSNYPGGWEQVNDGRNLLASAAPLRVDARLDGKARLAYEFDTPATNTSCYLYPALAAHFRAGEVQIACQFQYDSISTARWNTDWNAHWLNWRYTPTKAVSFMIGGEAFRSLPRGAYYDVGDWKQPVSELRLGGLLTSFTANNCAFAGPDRALYAGSPDTLGPAGAALPWPERPIRIVGTGSSRYVEYGGTGAYILDAVSTSRYRLILNPDARLVGNSLAGGFQTPVAELDGGSRLFKLRLSGWERAGCRPSGGRAAIRQAPGGGWLLSPGVYQITKGALR